ncbi:hypothetical protein GCM10022271_09560 [Corallibacter vietnamensis]|uniref:histidine kinase n=1 Tax=Corallibacter vietnamensis TaxID=904130 RepID=A0ABP7H2I3_9FLAO
MRFSILFIVFLSTILSSFSQNKLKVDSLLNIVTSRTNDSIKMVAYNKLRRATYFSNPKKAQEYTHKYLEYAKRRKDSFHIAIAHFYLGNTFVTQSDFKPALEHYFNASSYFERVKDSTRLSSILNAIGAVYLNNKNDSLSLKYFKQSQKISESLKDYRRNAIALNNISDIYKTKGDIETSIYYLESAYESLKKDGSKQYVIPLSLNLANAYSEVKKHKKALNLYNNTLSIVDTINDVVNYANILKSMGNFYIKRKEYITGTEYLKSAFDKYTKANFFDDRYHMMPELINAYTTTNNPDKALSLFHEYNTIKDSLFTIEKDKNLTELLQKFEVEKKDAQLKLLKLETQRKEQQKRLYLYISISICFIACFLGFFYYKNQLKNKQLAKQKLLLENTIDEKNILLKEVHHRVKNSFQIVSSLLYLQSENLDDKEAKLAIKEAENRVKSMVLIHQKLYNKDELIGINTYEYFNDLVKDIFESHQLKKRNITYKLNVDALVLDIETITPIGLILNELIINTLKHAFMPANKHNSLIIITFKKINSLLELKVIDNGKGFSGEVKETSFGIKIIKALSKKLKASLNYNSKPNTGTTVTLIIKKFNILS